MRAFSIILGFFKLLLIVYHCSNNVAKCTLLTVLQFAQHLYQQTIRAVCSSFKVLTDSLSGRLRELKGKEKKSKEKVKLANPKSGCGRLREHFMKEFE